MRPPSVSVVLPVYRNEAFLVELHRRLRDVFVALDLPYEILFVNDASPDGSLEVLKELAESDPNVAVLSLARNVGQHAAVLIGLEHALGERVVVLDADLQDPPEAIPNLLAKLEEGYAAVFAALEGPYEPFLRRVSSAAFKRIAHFLARIPATAGTFVVMEREVVDRITAIDVERPYFIGMIGLTGLPIASVPVVRVARPSGESAYSFLARIRFGVRSMMLVLALRWGRRRPPGRKRTELVHETFGTRFTPPKG